MTLRYESGEMLRTANLPTGWINRAPSWTWMMRFKLHSGSQNGNWFAYINHLDMDQNSGFIRIRARNGSNNSTNMLFNMPLTNVGDGQWHTLWFYSDQATDRAQAAWDGVIQLNVPWQGTLRANLRSDPIKIGDTSSFTNSATIAEVGIYTGLVPVADRAAFVAGTKTVEDIVDNRAVAYMFKKHVPGSFFNQNGTLRHVQTSNTNVDGFVAEPFALTDSDLIEIGGTGVNLDDGPETGGSTPAVGWVNENPGDEWVGDVHATQTRWPTGPGGRQLRLLFDPPRPGRAVVPIPSGPFAGENHYPKQESGIVSVGCWNLERFAGRNPTQAEVDNKVATILGKLGDLSIAVLLETLNAPAMEYLNEQLQLQNRFPYILTSAYSRPSRQVGTDNNFFLFDRLNPGSDRFNDGNNFSLGPWDTHLQLLTTTGNPAFGTFEGEAFDGRNQPYTATIKHPQRFDHCIMSRIPVSRHYQLDLIRRRQGRDDSPARNFPDINGVAGVLVAEYQPDANNLIVCAVHMDPAQDGSIDKFNRRETIEILLEWLQAGPLAADFSRSRIVICGDLNGTTDPAAPGGLPGGTANRCEWQKPLHDAGFRNAWEGVPQSQRQTRLTSTLDHFYTLNVDTPTAAIVPGTKNDGPAWGQPGGKPDHALIRAPLEAVDMGERDNVRVTERGDEEWWWSWNSVSGTAASLGNVRQFVRKPIGGGAIPYDPATQAARYAAEAKNLGLTGLYDVAWVIQSFGQGQGAPDYRDELVVNNDNPPATTATIEINGYDLTLDDTVNGPVTINLQDAAYDDVGKVHAFIAARPGWKSTLVGNANRLSIFLFDIPVTSAKTNVTVRSELQGLSPSIWQHWCDGVQHLTNHAKSNNPAFGCQLLGGGSDPVHWFKTLYVANGINQCRQWMADFIAAFKVIADSDPDVQYPVRCHMDVEDAIYIGGLSTSAVHNLWSLQQADARYQTEILPGINMTLEAAYQLAGSPTSNPGLPWDDPVNRAFADWYDQIAFEVMDGALEEAVYRQMRIQFPRVLCSNYNTSVRYDGQGTPARKDYYTPEPTEQALWHRFAHVGTAELQAEVFYFLGAKFADIPGGETRKEADLRITEELIAYQRDSTGKGGSDLAPWILQLNEQSGDESIGGPFTNDFGHMDSKVQILRAAGVKEFLVWSNNDASAAEWDQMASIIQIAPSGSFTLDAVNTISHTRLELLFTDGLNPPSVRYRVERSFNGGSTWGPSQRMQAAESLGGGQWRWEDSVLPPNTTVTYRIRGVSATSVVGLPTSALSGTTALDPGPLGLPVFVKTGGPT